MGGPEPLLHFLYPDNVSWTVKGYGFTRHVKLPYADFYWYPVGGVR